MDVSSTLVQCGGVLPRNASTNGRAHVPMPQVLEEKVDASRSRSSGMLGGGVTSIKIPSSSAATRARGTLGWSDVRLWSLRHMVVKVTAAFHCVMMLPLLPCVRCT